jgi:hypothetical protein
MIRILTTKHVGITSAIIINQLSVEIPEYVTTSNARVNRTLMTSSSGGGSSCRTSLVEVGDGN